MGLIKFESPDELEEKVKKYLGKDYDTAYEYIPYYFRFQKKDENRLHFQDSVHWPVPLKPIDILIIQVMQWTYCMPQHLLHKFPTSRGADWRILNGYVYLSPMEVSDQDEIQERLEAFMESARKYYSNWNELWDKRLKEEILPRIERVQNIDFENMPAEYQMIEDFDTMIHDLFKVWEIHFEFLGLGYAAYVTLMNEAKGFFPGMEDRIITKFCQGLGTIMMETDRKFLDLAKLAIELGVEDILVEGMPEDIITELEKSNAGKKWLDEFNRVMEEWGNRQDVGLYFGYISWRENPIAPISIIRNYIVKLRRGEEPLPPKEALEAERERLIQEYVDLLDSEEDKKRFREVVQLAQLVYPYVEDHNFYIDQKFDVLVRLKLLEIGRRFTKKGYIDEPEDISFLTPDEIRHALLDMIFDHGGRLYSYSGEGLKDLIQKRKKVYELQKQWTPPKLLGVAPDKITEPLFVQLWGITKEAIEIWTSPDKIESADKLKGFAASPGIAEGVARVLNSPEEISKLREGEILVCSCTTPAWTSVFPTVKAVVTDIGGLMSHAAIVSREYGIPAVVGTLTATKTIQSGQKIRVNGDQGIVEILE
jgi:pyruvate,water dikinase